MCCELLLSLDVVVIFQSPKNMAFLNLGSVDSLCRKEILSVMLAEGAYIAHTQKDVCVCELVSLTHMYLPSRSIYGFVWVLYMCLFHSSMMPLDCVE